MDPAELVAKVRVRGFRVRVPTKAKDFPASIRVMDRPRVGELRGLGRAIIKVKDTEEGLLLVLPELDRVTAKVREFLEYLATADFRTKVTAEDRIKDTDKVMERLDLVNLRDRVNQARLEEVLPEDVPLEVSTILHPSSLHHLARMDRDPRADIDSFQRVLRGPISQPARVANPRDQLQ